MILFVHARKRIFIRENQMGLSASTMDAILEFLAKCLTFFGMTLTFIYGGNGFLLLNFQLSCNKIPFLSLDFSSYL